MPLLKGQMAEGENMRRNVMMKVIYTFIKQGMCSGLDNGAAQVVVL
jgi:hypothetical protein